MLGIFMTLIFGKNVMLFYDGTGNSEDTSTNIYKMYDKYDGEIEVNGFVGRFNTTSKIKRNKKDVVIYISGIATTDDETMKYVQGFTGYGIEGWVSVGYEFLVKEMEKDDVLRIFGFSRGATTARVLSHYLDEYGIHKANLAGSKLENTLLQPKNPSVKGWIPDIAFLGLFDSVTAVSTAQGTLSILKQQIRKRSVLNDLMGNIKDATKILNKEAENFWQKVNVVFKSHKLIKYSDFLGKNVLKCSHAVAINEYRTMFNYSSIDLSNENFSQMYFIGSHSDIGGSRQIERSNIALQWMLDQGNLFEYFPGILPEGFNAVDSALKYPIYDSYADPLADSKTNRRTEQYLLPVFNRSFISFIDLVHTSVAPVATYLNITINQTRDRDAVASMLRLTSDFQNGNTSLSNVTKPKPSESSAFHATLFGQTIGLSIILTAI